MGKLNFNDMGLDDRILKAVAKLGWSLPTPIQQKAIPLALDGKDVIARAQTGSGKTAAYVIPIVQSILNAKRSQGTDFIQKVVVVIMVPSRELSNQTCNMIGKLTTYCSRYITCIDVSSEQNTDVLKPALSLKPDIVVGTPSRILSHIKANNLQLSRSLQYLVIDEADLLFSFGYEDDVKHLVPCLSTNYQALMMSATLNDEINTIKSLLLHNPVCLNLCELDSLVNENLTQYHVVCDTVDNKYLLIYALMKLKLIQGKSILFVNSIDNCYRLKLFLEQFSIASCVLNSELPVVCRCHVVEQFNKGLYKYIVATDESTLVTSAPSNGTEKLEKSKKHKLKKSKEYGVSRGIDFEDVKNVINFDFPSTTESYIHRVGRTARGDNKGTALSFVLPEESDILKQAQTELALNNLDDLPLKPYQFKMQEIEGFRYRCKDAFRSVTKTAVRQARIKELRMEMLSSDKLRSYFEENPNDLKVLRHDRVSQPRKIKKHLKHVPAYLIPPSLKGMYSSSSEQSENTVTSMSKKRKVGGKPNPKYKRKRADPLKNL